MVSWKPSSRSVTRTSRAKAVKTEERRASWSVMTMTMSSDVFGGGDSNPESALYGATSLMVVSLAALCVHVLFVACLALWFAFALSDWANSRSDDDRFVFARECGVAVSGVMAMAQSVCMFVSVSGHGYVRCCGCFHVCWSKIANRYALAQMQRKPRQPQAQKLPFLLSTSRSTSR